MNPLITVGGTLMALFLIALVLILVARATKWRPTPFKPLWAVLVIVAADVVAGLSCSIYASDIHVLYWWLLGLPIVAIGIPLVVVATTLCVRLVNVAVFSILCRHRSKR